MDMGSSAEVCRPLLTALCPHDPPLRVGQDATYVVVNVVNGMTFVVSLVISERANLVPVPVSSL